MANIVLIHGMWSHPGVADSLRTRLRQLGHHVLAPTLPGHDRRHPLSDSELGSLSLADYVESTEKFILEQEFDEAPLLIGHSMGGLIAQLLAVRMPLSGLVLINSAAPAGINHITYSSFRSSASILSQFGLWNQPYKPEFRRACYGLFNELDPCLARQIYDTLVPESGRCFFETVFWWLDRKHTTRITEPIESPILILSSGKDRIVHPSVARRLQKRYPAAKFLHYPENGHWLFHEKGCLGIYREISDWIEALMNDRNSIPELPNATHEPSRSSCSSPIPSRFDGPLDHSGSHCGDTAENSETGGGPILPR